jgi:hypothetical protein
MSRQRVVQGDLPDVRHAVASVGATARSLAVVMSVARILETSSVPNPFPCTVRIEERPELPQPGSRDIEV